MFEGEKSEIMGRENTMGAQPLSRTLHVLGTHVN